MVKLQLSEAGLFIHTNSLCKRFFQQCAGGEVFCIFILHIEGILVILTKIHLKIRAIYGLSLRSFTKKPAILVTLFVFFNLDTEAKPNWCLHSREAVFALFYSFVSLDCVSDSLACEAKIALSEVHEEVRFVKR